MLTVPSCLFAEIKTRQNPFDYKLGKTFNFFSKIEVIFSLVDLMCSFDFDDKNIGMLSCTNL